MTLKEQGIHIQPCQHASRRPGPNNTVPSSDSSQRFTLSLTVSSLLGVLLNINPKKKKRTLSPQTDGANNVRGHQVQPNMLFLTTEHT